MSNEPNQDFLQRFADGDREAFETLFRTFEHEVYRWILRIVRDESVAEESVVEAFWRCYRSRARLDPTRSFGAWMRRIATRVALDLLKAPSGFWAFWGIPGIQALNWSWIPHFLAISLFFTRAMLKVLLSLGRLSYTSQARMPVCRRSSRNSGTGPPQLKRYGFLYGVCLLLIISIVGLGLTYRSVVHEMSLAQLKSDYLASVTHEFRSPIANVQALLERIESGKALTHK